MIKKYLQRFWRVSEENPHLRFAGLTTILGSTGIALLEFFDNLYYDQDFAYRNFSVLGMLMFYGSMGAVVTSFVSAWLLRHPRKKIMIPVIVTVSVGFAWLVLNFFSENNLWRHWITGAFLYFCMGVAMTVVIFLFLAVSKALLVVLFPLLVIISYGYDKDRWYVQCIYIALLIGTAGYVFWYFSHVAKLDRNQVKKIVWSRYSLLLGILVIGMVFLAAEFSKYIMELRKDWEDTRQKMVQDEIQQRNDSALVFDERAVILAPRIAGYYRAEEPLYLKTHVFDIVQSSELMINPAYLRTTYYSRYQDTSVGEKPGKPIQVIYRQLLNQGVPSAERVQSFQNQYFSPGEGVFEPIAGFYRSITATQFLEYTYTKFDPEQDIQRTRSIARSELKNPSAFTIVNSSMPRYGEVRKLALEVTRNARSDYEKAKAIEKYLVENYYYTLAPNIRDQANPIDDFILDTKQGYCTHFATAMNVMLDSVGVRSRLVGGFYSDTKHPTLDAYLLLSSDLHVWVEVYIDGYGWAPFEPTTYRLAPGTPVSQLTGSNRKLTEYLPPNIDYLLSAVDPQMRFDNAFEMKIETGLQIAQDGVSIERTRNEWSPNPGNNGNGVGMTPEQQAKLQEEQRRKEQEMKKTLESVVWLLWGGVILSAMIAIGWYLRWRYLNRVTLKKQQHRRLARKIDEKLREEFIKVLGKHIPDRSNQQNHGEKDEFLHWPSSEFLALVRTYEKRPEVLQDWSEVYETIDLILYAPQFGDADVLKLKKRSEQVRQSLKSLKNMKKGM